MEESVRKRYGRRRGMEIRKKIRRRETHNGRNRTREEGSEEL